MNRKIAFNKIFEIIEEIEGITYTKKYHKENIIEALAQTDISESEYLGYKTAHGFSRLMNRLIIVDLKKPKYNNWSTYLLYLINLKYCNICKEVLDINKFGKDNRTKTKLSTKCKQCDNNRAIVYRKENKHISKQYYQDNREKLLNDSKQRKLNNPEYYQNYYQEHKEEYLARVNKRRANKLNATPKWSEDKLIKEFYKNRPKNYHVDHIIPLQNNLVCGLHVISNLQYLTAKDNLSKGNRFEV